MSVFLSFLSLNNIPCMYLPHPISSFETVMCSHPNQYCLLAVSHITFVKTGTTCLRIQGVYVIYPALPVCWHECAGLVTLVETDVTKVIIRSSQVTLMRGSLMCWGWGEGKSKWILGCWQSEHRPHVMINVANQNPAGLIINAVGWGKCLLLGRAFQKVTDSLTYLCSEWVT